MRDIGGAATNWSPIGHRVAIESEHVVVYYALLALAGSSEADSVSVHAQATAEKLFLSE